MKRLSALILSLVLLLGCTLAFAEEPTYIGEIDLGLCLGMTGDEAVEGNLFIQGVTAVVDKVNAEGGVQGYKINLVKMDSGYDTDTAINGLNLIYETDVVAVIGPHKSTQVSACKSLIEKNTIPTIVGGTNYKLPSTDNNYMFLGRTNDSIQASAMGKFIIKNTDVKKVGIMYSSDDFGQGGFEVISGILAEAGVDFVGEPHNGQDTDYYSTLLKMQNAGCNALVVWTGATPAPIIIRQLNELGLNSEMQIYFAQCLGSSAVHSALDSTDLLDGMYTVQETFLDPNNAEMMAFADECAAKEVYASDAATRNYINVAQFVVNVLQRAEDPTSRESVKQALESTDNQELMFGTFSCDEYHMVNHSAAICQWKKDIGGMELIESIQG